MPRRSYTANRCAAPSLQMEPRAGFHLFEDGLCPGEGIAPPFFVFRQKLKGGKRNETEDLPRLQHLHPDRSSHRHLGAAARHKKPRNEDVGGEALAMGFLKAQQAAEAKDRKAAEKESGGTADQTEDSTKPDSWGEDF